MVDDVTKDGPAAETWTPAVGHCSEHVGRKSARRHCWVLLRPRREECTRSLGGGWVVRLLPPHDSWGRRPRRLRTRAGCVNVDPEPGSGSRGGLEG
eukprot:221238-Prorocentrum_minimum.AAC.1